jgi:hypothetical protein
MRKFFFLLLIPFLLFSNPQFIPAQDNQQTNLIYEWSDFSGGLNTKLSQYSLPKNQGVICENVRFNVKLNALTKRDETLTYGTADTTEAITGMHRLYLNDGTKVLLVVHGDEIEKGTDATGGFTTILDLSTGNYRWQWLTWNNIAIGTDGYNQPVKYDGSSASATYLGTCLATDAGSGTGPTGTGYSYKVTFYTTSYEVAFNVASNPLTMTGNDIDLTMIPIGPDTYEGESVTGRKIYRNKTGGSTWYLLSNGTIADNSTVILTDSDADTDLLATEYPTTYTCTPPKGKLCLINYNRLFLANDPNAPSRLYYGDDGSADYFVPTDYYMDIRPDDGDQITFALTWLGKLTVGKENSIQFVYTDGSTPSTDWSVSDPFTKIGCKAMYTAKITPLGIIYLGSDGLYKFGGQYSQLISDAVTPEIKDISETNISNCWSEYHKSIYYMAYTSKSVGGSANNRVLLFDLLSNAYSIDTISANSFCTFGSGTDWDVLYYGSSSDGKVYAYQSQAYEIMHGRHSDFSGTFTDARYIPTAVGGDADNPVIEIARTGTINAMTGTINEQTGTIDRDSLTGSYISQALNIGASTYNKVYWNPHLVSSDDAITVAIRSAATEAGLSGASWSSEYSDPSGSDISALTANVWMQYRISMTTDAYTHSPTVVKANNYNVKISYNKEGSAGETTVPLHWKSGYTDFGYPNRNKVLKKLYSLHSGASGTLTLKISNLEGESDTFDIELSDNPNSYEEYFTTGKFLGKEFNLDISNSDLNNLEIYKVGIIYDLEPIL